MELAGLYYTGSVGGVCPAPDVILDSAECSSALDALGRSRDNPWEGSPTDTLPPGCSWQAASAGNGEDKHFNKPFKGQHPKVFQASLTPICKFAAPFEQWPHDAKYKLKGEELTSLQQRGLSFRECVNTCRGDASCVAFSWNPRDWSFFYKSVNTAAREMKYRGTYSTGWESYVINKSNNSTATFEQWPHDANYQLKGEELEGLQQWGVSFQACVDQCLSDENCVAFSWNPENWSYFFKTVKTPANEMRYRGGYEIKLRGIYGHGWKSYFLGGIHTWTIELRGSDYTSDRSNTTVYGRCHDQFRVTKLATPEDNDCRMEHGVGSEVWLQQSINGGSSWTNAVSLGCDLQNITIHSQTSDTVCPGAGPGMDVDLWILATRSVAVLTIILGMVLFFRRRRRAAGQAPAALFNIDTPSIFTIDQPPAPTRELQLKVRDSCRQGLSRKTPTVPGVPIWDCPHNAELCGQHAECCICCEPLCEHELGLLTENNTRVCRHFFHKGCIESIMRQPWTGSRKCPICRAAFDGLLSVPDMQADTKAWFEAVGYAKDGQLSPQETIDALKACLPIDIYKWDQHQDKWWSKWDTDGSGYLRYEELFDAKNGLIAWVKETFYRENTASLNTADSMPDITVDKLQWFDYWDTLHTGALTKAQVTRALVKSLGLNMDDISELNQIKEAVDSVWSVWDSTNTGSISKEDFALPDGMADAIIALLVYPVH